MDLSPPSASGTYLSVILFSGAYLFDTCSCEMIYIYYAVYIIYISASRRDSAVYIRWDWGWGTRNKTSTATSQQNVHGNIAAIATATSLQSNLIRRENGKCIRRRHMRSYVDDSVVACAVPTGYHINIDNSHAFHYPSLLSRLG